MVLNWRSERRERERLAREQGRIPPGQSLTDKFPVLTYESRGQWPANDLNRWELDVYGEVTTPLHFDFASLRERFETVDLTFDIHCVTRWSKLDTRWTGIRVRDIVEAAGPTAEARFLVSHSYTGYTANVPLENALTENSMVAWQFDGQAIEPDHGGPVRLIIDPQQLYLWKSTKFLRGLELTAVDQPGFWERLGYNNRGDIWLEERFWSDSGLRTRRDVERRAETT